MVDQFGRTIDYMRLSVTDRCNLYCRYCMPNGVVPVAHNHVLTYEELLRVAGQWSPERMAKSCTDSKLWILVSQNDAKAFPGMNAVADALADAGVKVGRYLWNAKSTPAEFDALAADALADDVQVRYTVFQGSSVVPEGRGENPGANHVCTWPVAYEIESVKEWLFAQKR